MADTQVSDRGAETGEPPEAHETLFLAPEGRYQNPAGGLVEVGSGGLGRVLLVRDTALGREVALKEIAGGAAAARGSANHRFIREARLAGQLEHPGIVPVYDFARDADGRLFYVMRRIEGRTLAELIHDAPALRDRLALVPHVLAMSQALAYAHSRGVVHRDIKPQNVMVGPFGETLLLDWGLARAKSEPGAVLATEESDEPTLSRRGAPFGTPAYMSPEQALGRLDEVDERSDLWMLGAVLFQVLTRRPPYADPAVEAAVAKARIGAVPAVTELQPDAPPELAAVVARCLAKDKAERYPDVAPLIRDLQSWLSGRRVSAYEYSAAELARRFIRRYRLPLAVGTTLLVTLLAALAVVEVRVRKERDEYRELSMMVLGEAVEAIRQTPGERKVVIGLAKKVRETLERGSWLNSSVEDRRMLHRAVYTSGLTQLEAGNLADAEESLRFAIELSDSLLREQASAALLADAANDRTSLASSLHQQNRLAEADQVLDAALGLAQRARALDPANPDAAHAEELALSIKIGVASQQGRYLEAIPWAERGLEIERGLFAGKTLRARDHYNRVIGHDQLAEICQEAGQHDRAVQAFRGSLEALARFEEEYPKSSDSFDATYFVSIRGALLEFEEGHVEQAQAHLVVAGQAIDRLLQAEPGNPEHLSRRIVVDFYRGSLEGMRTGLHKLEKLPSLGGANGVAIPAMLVVWPPERVLQFAQRHPELVTKDARLHLALAAALAGQTARAGDSAQALADDPLQTFSWSAGLIEHRLIGWGGPAAEAVRVLARELDASVAPRDPARRREALRRFAVKMREQASDGG